MRRLLKREFFNRKTLIVAKSLLGKYLVRKLGGKIIALQISEVEAYDGPYDRASHASRGLTKRNSPMFGQAGNFYVYLTYGMHWMLNVVTGPKNYPAAILIRAVRLEPSNSFTRSCRSKRINLRCISGPARLTKFLSINKSLNGKPSGRKAGLWFEDSGVKIHPRNITRLARVGVDYAGPIWSKKPYRYFYSDKLNKSHRHAHSRTAWY